MAEATGDVERVSFVCQRCLQPLLNIIQVDFFNRKAFNKVFYFSLSEKRLHLQHFVYVTSKLGRVKSVCPYMKYRPYTSLTGQTVNEDALYIIDQRGGTNVILNKFNCI